jgi:hypothetical protein
MRLLIKFIAKGAPSMMAMKDYWLKSWTIYTSMHQIEESQKVTLRQ